LIKIEMRRSLLLKDRDGRSRVAFVQAHKVWARLLEGSVVNPSLPLCSQEKLVPELVHVVDDDAAFRTAIKRRLNIAGYEVVTYSSAQHLLDRMPSESEFGCILLDVRMPGLSGPELQVA
jgi:PleD family two-component response regulator